MRPRLRRRYRIAALDIDGALHDLDSRGTAVGHRIDATGTMRAVIVTPAGVSDLGTLGGSAASARGINDAGTIVGGSLTDGDVSYHAFLCEDGVMHDLNALIPPDVGCELIQALGINDRGHILAIGHYAGADRVLLLTPDDEREEPS